MEDYKEYDESDVLLSVDYINCLGGSSTTYTLYKDKRFIRKSIQFIRSEHRKIDFDKDFVKIVDDDTYSKILKLINREDIKIVESKALYEPCICDGYGETLILNTDKEHYCYHYSNTELTEPYLNRKLEGEVTLANLFYWIWKLLKDYLPNEGKKYYTDNHTKMHDLLHDIAYDLLDKVLMLNDGDSFIISNLINMDQYNKLADYGKNIDATIFSALNAGLAKYNATAQIVMEFDEMKLNEFSLDLELVLHKNLPDDKSEEFFAKFYRIDNWILYQKRLARMKEREEEEKVRLEKSKKKLKNQNN